MILTMYFKGLQPCWVVTHIDAPLSYAQAIVRLTFAIEDMERYWAHENTEQPISICLTYADFRFEMMYSEHRQYDSSDWRQLLDGIEYTRPKSLLS